MPTKPKHDYRSIAVDARHIHDAALEDLRDPQFKKRVSKHDCDTLSTSINALELAEGGTSSTLHVQVEAGVHAAQARAAVISFLRDVRDDARLAFPGNEALLHAFGVGANPQTSSTASTRHAADALLAAAHAHPTEAAKVGLDKAGVRQLEDVVHALDGADLAHVHTQTARHENSAHTDSLAHAVSAQVAHIRVAARRVFRDDATRLARYETTLPRHEVIPRHPKVTPVPAAPATT